MTDPRRDDPLATARRPERVDLDIAERVINRPHIIELRDDGFTVMHPPACHPRLFDCPVTRAATRDLKGAPKPSEMGEFYCDLRPNGRLRIGERAPDSEGIDWAALVAELRALRRAGLGVLTGAFESRDFKATLEVPRSLIDDLARLLTDPDQSTGAAP